MIAGLEEMGTESSIEFIRWPYDDDAWHVGVRATDGGYCVEQEFYTYPAELLEFASRLSAFSTNHAHEIFFEVGSKKPEWAHWVFLRVFIVDAAGHAAVTIDVGNHGDELRKRSARFTIGCDIASINRLGDQLRQWVERPHESLHHVLYSS